MYKANSRSDVQTLANNIMNHKDRNKILTVVYIHGLMNFPILLKIILWWICVWVDKNDREQAITEFFRRIELQGNHDIRDMIADISDHVVNGIDMEDQTSVGGWSQREIDLFVKHTGI